MGAAARVAWVGVGMMLVFALFLLLRPDDEAGDAPSATVAPPTAGASVPGSPPAQTRPVPTAVNVTLVVANGRPVGGRPKRLSVARGRTIAFTIRADVADEVHVHGYDVKRKVSPGRVSRLDLEADVPGRFEIELERRHVVIAELEVRP